MIEGLRGKHLGQFGVAGHYADFQRVEQLGKSLGQHLRGTRHHFRRLENGPVARGQYASQRAEQGKQRRIPGTQNADGPFGLMHHPGLGAQLVIGRKHLPRLVLNPVGKMVARILERCQRPQYVVHQ